MTVNPSIRRFDKTPLHVSAVLTAPLRQLRAVRGLVARHVETLSAVLDHEVRITKIGWDLAPFHISLVDTCPLGDCGVVILQSPMLVEAFFAVFRL